MRKIVKHYFIIPFLWEGVLTMKLRNRRLLDTWVAKRYHFMFETALNSLISQTNPSPILVEVAPQFRSIIDDLVKDRPLPALATLIEKVPGWRINPDVIQKNADMYYLTRLDSDDLYHNSVADEIKKTTVNSGVRTLLYQKGFVHQWKTSRIMPYYHSNPPFYTDIFTKSEIFHNKGPKRRGHHIRLGNAKILSPGKFVVVCHTKGNASSTFDKLVRRSVTNKFSKELRESPHIISIPASLCEFGVRSAMKPINIAKATKRSRFNKNVTAAIRENIKHNEPKQLGNFKFKTKQNIRHIKKPVKPNRVIL